MLAGLKSQPAQFWALIVATLIIGVALIQYGRSLEPYTDTARAHELLAAEYCHNGSTDNDGQSAQWYRDMDSVLTARYPIINTGCSFVVAALTLAMLSLWLGKFRVENVTVLRTPRQKWKFFVLGIAAILGGYGAVAVGLSLDLDRRMFPWCADSIAIPLFSFGFATLIFLPIALMAGGAISWFFRDLPVALNCWDRQNHARSWGVTILFGAISLLWLWLMVHTAPTADFLFVAPGIVAVYLTLSCRAALLAPKTMTAD